MGVIISHYRDPHLTTNIYSGKYIRVCFLSFRGSVVRFLFGRLEGGFFRRCSTTSGKQVSS